MATGAPVVGADVNDGSSNDARTDADGRYTLQELQFGGYVITASFPGMQSQWAQVGVTLTNPSPVQNFTLLWMTDYSTINNTWYVAVSTATGSRTLTDNLTTHAPDPGTGSCAYVTDTRTGVSSPMSLQRISASGVIWTVSVQLPQGSQEGQFQLVGKILDCASGIQVDTGATANYTVDNSPPRLVAVRPEPGTTVSTQSPVVSIELADGPDSVDGSTLVTSVDGHPILPSSGTPYSEGAYKGVLNYSTTALGAGPHTVVVSMADYAGNATTQSWSFTVDPSATPAQPTYGSPAPTGTTDAVAPLITVTVSDPAASLQSVTLTLSDGVQSSNLWANYDVFAGVVTYQVPDYTVNEWNPLLGGSDLHDGTYTVSLSVVDADGTRSATSWQFTVHSLPVVSGPLNTRH